MVDIYIFIHSGSRRRLLGLQTPAHPMLDVACIARGVLLNQDLCRT